MATEPITGSDAGIDSIGSIDSSIDAPGDGSVDSSAVDASTMLALGDVSPSIIYEGQGDGGSLPALIVIRGHNIDATASVAIAPATGIVDLVVGAPTVASSGEFIAFEVTAHVDPLLGTAGAEVIDLDVTVTQPSAMGTVTQTLVGKLGLQALPELTSLVIVPPGEADTAQLQPLYSKIELSSIFSVTMRGTKPAIFRAVSSVRANRLRAAGESSTGATRGRPGAGGCFGGAPGMPGECDGGGAAGASGGGGAGFVTPGIPGAGPTGGAGGPRSGHELVGTYEGFGVFTANRGSGGGGSATGAGGAGGGTIELTAGGAAVALMIFVDGAGGGGGSTPGERGGCGAGGVVVLRGGSGAAASEVYARNGCGINGDGRASDGRIRWDAPMGGVGTAETEVHRGPAFVPGPRVFTESMPALSLIGTSTDRVTVYTVDHDGVVHDGGADMFGSDGMLVIHPTLHPGRNRVCVTVFGGQPGTPEADTCVEVAVVP